MKIIEINSKIHGLVKCLVDDEDYNWIISEYNIYACKVGKAIYIDCRRKIDGGRSSKYKLHRIIYSRYFDLKNQHGAR